MFKVLATPSCSFANLLAGNKLGCKIFRGLTGHAFTNQKTGFLRGVVRSKCNIFSAIRSCVICFSFAYANQFIPLFVLLFSFFCVNLGVYFFLSVFAPSLAFLCCFIFISAFLSFYSFIFRMFQRIFHIVVLQYCLCS